MKYVGYMKNDLPGTRKSRQRMIHLWLSWSEAAIPANKKMPAQQKAVRAKKKSMVFPRKEPIFAVVKDRPVQTRL